MHVYWNIAGILIFINHVISLAEISHFWNEGKTWNFFPRIISTWFLHEEVMQGNECVEVVMAGTSCTDFSLYTLRYGC